MPTAALPLTATPDPGLMPAPQIADLICTGRDEQVVIEHPGPLGSQPIDLSNWTLYSVTGEQSLVFDGQSLAPLARLVVHSGPDAPENSPGHLRWRRSYIWTDGDIAQLLAPTAQVIDERACP